MIDPTIDEFEAFFAPQTGGKLSAYERELLRSVLYWLLKGPPTP